MIIKVIKVIKLMTRKILIVAAHPDDEMLGCAGVSAKNIMAGDEVHVLFMTNGVDARNEDSAKELERQRKPKQLQKKPKSILMWFLIRSF